MILILDNGNFIEIQNKNISFNIRFKSECVNLKPMHIKNFLSEYLNTKKRNFQLFDKYNNLILKVYKSNGSANIYFYHYTSPFTCQIEIVEISKEILKKMYMTFL